MPFSTAKLATAFAEVTDLRVKILETGFELQQYFRLRYEVYSGVSYLTSSNSSRLDIDEYDIYAIPFGAISTSSQQPLGTLRLVTGNVQPCWRSHIDRIVERSRDAELARQAFRPRPSELPSIKTDLIKQMLKPF